MSGCRGWEWGLCAGPGCPTCNRLYCGCCGAPIGTNVLVDTDWCSKCLPHISITRRALDGQLAPPWERTYQAMHHEPCPFQVGDDA